jgi:hypothetical protein
MTIDIYMAFFKKVHQSPSHLMYLSTIQWFSSGCQDTVDPLASSHN